MSWEPCLNTDSLVNGGKTMTRSQIELAVKEGIPFVIRMADGEKYEVADQSQIAFGKTFVIVVQDDLPHVLPLLTMTGLSYLKPKSGAS
jgi:hypothetical protein